MKWYLLEKRPNVLHHVVTLYLVHCFLSFPQLPVLGVPLRLALFQVPVQLRLLLVQLVHLVLDLCRLPLHGRNLFVVLFHLVQQTLPLLSWGAFGLLQYL